MKFGLTMGLLVGTFLLASKSVASEISEEGFVVRCEATVADSEETLGVNASLTISERPTGAGLSVSYELLDLPYNAEVKIEFGDERDENRWTMFFLDLSSSMEFGRAEATISPLASEFLITSKTPDMANQLTFSCKIQRSR